jgi:8-amino-7-oxononanoate synthase
MLGDLAHHLYERLQNSGFQPCAEPIPVDAVRLSDIDGAIMLWKGLLEQGGYVNLLAPPATPDGGCLLRCSVSAGQTSGQIERIGEAFASLCQSPQTVQAV